VFERLRCSYTVCIDLEADQLNWRKDKILCIAFSNDPRRAYVFLPPYTEKFKQELIDLFDSPVSIVGHNIKFDLKFLIHQLGITNARATHDTMLAHYVLDENSRHGLKELLAWYFDVPDYEAELVTPHLSKDKRYNAVPTDKLVEYCATDTALCLKLWYKLSDELHDEELYHNPYRFPIMTAYPTIMDLEMTGMHYDRSRVDVLITEAEAEYEKKHRQLERMCGRKFNPNSWIQVSKIMYDHYKMPRVRLQNGKIGKTSRETRLLISQRLPEDSETRKWLDLFDEVKSVGKILSSYLKNMREIGDEDRVYPTYLLHGTVHGRLSARNPAIQTIPRKGTSGVWGERIKSMFTAPPNHVIMVVDYSQAEMRVAAAMSKDPFLLQVYKEGRDLHTETAIAVYGENFTKQQRGFCKNTNFALLYGGSIQSFIVAPGMDVAKTRQVLARYKDLMKGLFKWRLEQYKHLRKHGYVETPTGRLRRFPFINAANDKDAQKAAVNSPVAGMASDLTLISLIHVNDWARQQNFSVRPICTVHDSIILEVDDRPECVSHTAHAVVEIMERVGGDWFPEIPWKAEVEVGPSWGEVEEWHF